MNRVLTDSNNLDEYIPINEDSLVYVVYMNLLPVSGHVRSLAGILWLHCTLEFE